MGKTNIAWATDTWNPVTGCSRVSPGCRSCYAEALSLRFGWSQLPWTAANAAENVVLHDDRLEQPLRWRKPRRVFVNSMSDMFHEQVPDEFLGRVWNTMEMCSYPAWPDHRFLILTKRSGRMRDWVQDVMRAHRAYADKFDNCPTEAMRNSPAAKDARYRAAVPSQNIWLGVSIENDNFVGRADALRETPAAVRFISAEPLLGPLPSLDLTGISWLIVGGESGPSARPMRPEWVGDLVERADAVGTKVFVKQSAGLRPGRQGDLPDDLWARKESPE